MKRGDIVTLWGGTRRFRLKSFDGGASGSWCVEAENDPAAWGFAPESAMKIAPEGSAGRKDAGGSPPLPAPPALARNTDPDTAHQAAAKANSRVQADRTLVLVAHYRAGDAGLTGAELAAATGRAYESIGPRRPGLEDDGLIAKVPGVKRANGNGNPTQVYRITPAGVAEVERRRLAA